MAAPDGRNPTLRVRWLGRVPYRDALALQKGLWATSSDDHLLLLEHPPVYTLGLRADPAHVLADPAAVGAELVRADRGGDVTFHGPGQLVGYPILTVARPPALPDTPAYVHEVEQVVIDAVSGLGLAGARRLDGYPGVWIGPPEAPRKIAAVGVRLSKGRSRHGFALNVDPDLTMFDHIVPCGISHYGVTSLAAEGLDVEMVDVVEAVAGAAVRRWARGSHDRADVSWRVASSDLAPFTKGEGPGAVTEGERRGPVVGVSGEGEQPRSSRPGDDRSTTTPVRLLGRLAAAGVDTTGGPPISARKPEWLRVRANLGTEYRALRSTMRALDLVTVCEEAGCPNIYECWADGTATFMINGERCTRACGFCLVDTRHPLPADPDEPERVAEAVSRMGLAHSVVTAVARDDLPDGGAAAFASVIAAIRRRSPATAIEVLIPDCKGDPGALEVIFDARPDICNHNLETVARLQRAVRPSAGYARSLAVLARAKAAGLVTKSGLIVGMGETDEEVLAAIADLHAVGVDIVTIGQYLRPTSHHLPVDRWVEPGAFDRFREAGEDLGIPHVEASPLTRSSYHARQAAAGVGPGANPVTA